MQVSSANAAAANAGPMDMRGIITSLPICGIDCAPVSLRQLMRWPPSLESSRPNCAARCSGCGGRLVHRQRAQHLIAAQGNMRKYMYGTRELAWRTGLHYLLCLNIICYVAEAVDAPLSPAGAGKEARAACNQSELHWRPKH